MAKKKKTRRNQESHPDLDPRLNLKTRYDLYDQDYIHKLSPKEKDWLNKFNREYISGTVNRDNPKKNLHNTRKLIKSCDDRNNSRNRDILTRAKASHQLDDYAELIEEPTTNDYEEEIIHELDKKDARAAIDWLAENLNKDEERLEDKFINELKDKEETSPKRRR